MTFAQHMTECAKEYLRNCLTQADGNVMRAARIAGITRQTFYKLGVRCGLAFHDAREQKRRKAAHPFTRWITGQTP